MSTLTAPAFPSPNSSTNEREKDLLRFSTAGSVDDGKSTLIGRLLYDTQSVYEDQVRSIEGKGTTAPGQIDFALLTDGLRAEREQGITIDVAYRYFSTAKTEIHHRRHPGPRAVHPQYGHRRLYRRRLRCAHRRRQRCPRPVAPPRLHRLAAARAPCHRRRQQDGPDRLRRSRPSAPSNAISATCSSRSPPIPAIPSRPSSFPSARSRATTSSIARMRRCRGTTVHPCSNCSKPLPPSHQTHTEPFRFPVQRVLRPDHTFRGFSGQIASGTIRPGDAITVLPFGAYGQGASHRHLGRRPRRSLRAAFRHAGARSRSRHQPRRPDCRRCQPATVAKTATAALVWMDQRPLELNRRYLLKHTSHTVPAFIPAIHHRTDVATLTHEPAETFAMNDIGVVTLNLLRPIAIDLYARTARPARSSSSIRKPTAPWPRA